MTASVFSQARHVVALAKKLSAAVAELEAENDRLRAQRDEARAAAALLEELGLQLDKVREERVCYRAALVKIAGGPASCMFLVASTGETCREVYHRDRWCWACIAEAAIDDRRAVDGERDG